MKEPAPAEPRVTIDDLKHRALDVKSKAVAEAKGAVDTVLGDSAQRTLLIMVGVAVLAASVAYYLGTRSRRQFPNFEELLGE